MERLIYPHNILFNFWAETGLLGVVGFFGMFGYLGVSAYRLLHRNREWSILVLAILTVTLVHGMVDVPYFKNDLAMLWWVLGALMIII
jgi:O-antigen ligase